MKDMEPDQPGVEIAIIDFGHLLSLPALLTCEALTDPTPVTTMNRQHLVYKWRSSLLCREKERLFAGYVNSANALAEAARSLANRAGRTDTDKDFRLLMRSVQEAKKLAKRAKEVYLAHLTEHGC